MPPLLLLAAFLFALKFFAPYPKSSGVALRLLWLFAAAGGGASVYAASTVLARCPEWKWIKGAVAKKRS